MVPIYMFSFVFLKNNGRKMVGTQMEDKKYYGKIVGHQYWTLYGIMADIGRRFKNVKGIKWYWFPLLFLLCFWKITDKKTNWDTIGGKKYYEEITNHQYLTQYVIMVDKGRIFRTVQWIKRYWFLLCLSCFWRITDKKRVRHGCRKKNIIGRLLTISS